MHMYRTIDKIAEVTMRKNDFILCTSVRDEQYLRCCKVSKIPTNSSLKRKLGKLHFLFQNFYICLLCSEGINFNVYTVEQY